MLMWQKSDTGTGLVVLPAIGIGAMSVAAQASCLAS
jgi:hypothetical protein